MLTDLVGDLAAYRPGGTALILEGGGDVAFDKFVLSRLFSEELQGINIISGTDKNKVSELHKILEKAYKEGSISTKYFAIVDKDF